jgi:hypothetical protein
MLRPSISAPTPKTGPLLDQFKANKIIPPSIETNVLTALSFFPELTHTAIQFVFKHTIKASVMQAQPVVKSFFSRSMKRSYRINISANFNLTHTGIPIHQLPDAIMIGWIGHELGHIMDYENRSIWGMIEFGLGYVTSADFVKKAERRADTYAVQHGLGHYLVETKRFILDHAHLPQTYKDKIARLYVSPEEIVEQVRKLEQQTQQT